MNTSDFDSLDKNSFEKQALKNMSNSISKATEITKKNSRYVFITFMFNIFTIIIKMMIIFQLKRISFNEYKYNPFYISFILSIIGVAFATFGIFLLYTYSKSLNYGNVLYEEIADYMEWKRKAFTSNNPSLIPNSFENDFELRLNIKRFLRESDLPFIPGKLGTPIYFIIFILLAFFHISFNF